MSTTDSRSLCEVTSSDLAILQPSTRSGIEIAEIDARPCPLSGSPRRSVRAPARAPARSNAGAPDSRTRAPRRSPEGSGDELALVLLLDRGDNPPATRRRV